MDRTLPDLASLRPAGSKRSSKRDRILQVFLRQEGHVSADDLFDLVRREAAGIGRATVYRTLQWMVGAGIALRDRGFLVIPEESRSPAVLRRAWMHALRMSRPVSA